tara:strand:+ start:426 stop:596 length:171 start_codon:yes stop_codon:yes gene_type:complete
VLVASVERAVQVERVLERLQAVDADPCLESRKRKLVAIGLQRLQRDVREVVALPRV